MSERTRQDLPSGLFTLQNNYEWQGEAVVGPFRLDTARIRQRDIDSVFSMKEGSANIERRMLGISHEIGMPRPGLCAGKDKEFRI